MTCSDTTNCGLPASGGHALAGFVPSLHRGGQTDDIQRLVDKSCRGCQVSFNDLVSRYEKKILRFFYARTGRLPDAEDLAQETLISAWRNLRQFRRTGSFEGWLFSIAINKLRSRLRSRRFFLPLSIFSVSSRPGPSQINDNIDSAEQFWKTVRRCLSDEQFNALLLKYRCGLSIGEIAESMGKTCVSVKVLLHRGRCRLHKKLSKTSFLQDFCRQNAANSNTF